MTTIRQAIRGAADHIERTGEWDWRSCYVPDCGTPACALGWIAHYAGFKSGQTFCAVFKQLGCDDDEFYIRMCEIDQDWRDDEDVARIAKALRLYADKFHPAENPSVIPDAVRNIFTLTNEQLREALDA